MFKFNSELYRQVNKYPRQVAKDVISEFSHRFRFRPDGRDSLLDVGCGPGDITADYVLPVLPKQFSRIVGSDISEDMLSQARKRVQHSNASFEILDIGRPLDSRVWSKPFDHITSFFCLQYAKNERQAFLNIHKLLVDGGDCLHVILDRHPAFDVLYQVAKGPRWASRLEDIDNLMPDYQFVFDPIGGLKNTMKEIGFSEYDVQDRGNFAEFKGVGDFKSKCLFIQMS